MSESEGGAEEIKEKGSVEWNEGKISVNKLQ